MTKEGANVTEYILSNPGGMSVSVLDVIHAFSKACGKEIPYVIDPRRPGDIAECLSLIHI